MLDLVPLAEQIGEAGRRERDRRARAEAECDLAAEKARGFDADRAEWERQKARIRAAKTSWLVAHAASGLPAARTAAAPPPRPYVVMATDGSQIAPDRHNGEGGICLLNVGRVVLAYGNDQRARLDSRGELLPEVGEIGEDGEDNHDEHVAAAMVAPLRFAREMRELATLMEEAAASGIPAVALTDGPLIAWSLYDRRDDPDSAKRQAFDALKDTLRTAERLHIPIAGYISGSASRDAVSGLRITLCPDEPVNCMKCDRSEEAKPCRPIARAHDAGLFQRILQPGERSAVFSSQEQVSGFSQILKMYDPRDWVAFFYLNVGPEIARIEIPRWVAEDVELTERVHAVCWDQAQKGRGYPVALAEAHEQAVVRGPDRAAFLRMMERAMVAHGTPLTPTRKALAKRTRAV